MAIFVDQDTKVIVQGLTGGQGKFHGLRNRDYGTQVVAGVTPGKGGQDVEGIPVFDTVAEAVAATGATASFVAVPPKAAPAAILEAAAAGIGFIVCITEGIPAQDEARVYNTLGRDFPSTRLLGPNCPGIISPGKCNIGITPSDIAQLPTADGPNVGIVSRSGTLTYQALYELKQNGIGVSTCVGIGGDPVPGTSFVDCLAEFEKDPETHAIIMFGEIGGSAEEEAAEFITAKRHQADERLHRRRHRAGRQEDGPRRRHRVRRQGHGPGEDGRARRRRREGRAQPDRGRRADGRDRQGALTAASSARPTGRSAGRELTARRRRRRRAGTGRRRRRRRRRASGDRSAAERRRASLSRSVRSLSVPPGGREVEHRAGEGDGRGEEGDEHARAAVQVAVRRRPLRGSGAAASAAWPAPSRRAGSSGHGAWSALIELAGEQER